MGGWAGGKKFVVRGILFKLCNDVQLSNGQWLYGGADCDIQSANKGHSTGHPIHLPLLTPLSTVQLIELTVSLLCRSVRQRSPSPFTVLSVSVAHLFRCLRCCVKVGSHELRSAIRMFPYHSIGLRVPMMALIDWCGYRLLAMPLLPLPPSTTPLLGSSDGGNSVHSSDPTLTSIISRIGVDLHLSPHRVGPLTLYTAGDVEGHLGTDGRYYLLDLARCSPPESPALNPTVPAQSVLYRLLRPELLQLMKADNLPALSCDAFTQWGAQDGDVHNSRVTEATRLLYSRYLPALAEKLVTGHPTFADRQLEDDMEEEEDGESRRGRSLSVASQHYPATFDPDLELQAVGVDNIRFLRLSEELHCHGLNIRHLGTAPSLRHHSLPSLTAHGGRWHYCCWWRQWGGL